MTRAEDDRAPCRTERSNLEFRRRGPRAPGVTYKASSVTASNAFRCPL